MKKILINGVLIIILSWFMSSKYIDYIAFKQNGLPDLLLIFTVLSGLFMGAYCGMFFGFFIGLAVDLMGYQGLGFNAFIYTLIGYLCFIPNKYFQYENVLLATFIILIYYLIKTVIQLLLCFLINDQYEALFLIDLLYTVILSIPLFFIYHKIFNFNKSLKTHV